MQLNVIAGTTHRARGRHAAGGAEPDQVSTPVPGRAAGTTDLRPRVFEGPALPADTGVLRTLELGTVGVDLAAAPVVLPDFHHKRTMEMPSSIAVATAGTIRPTFTSSSVNCGMALIALDCDRPSDGAIADSCDG